MEQGMKSTSFVYKMLCNVLIWHLRLLTVPVEMLTHLDVGERYFGFSGLLAVLTMVAAAAYEGSALLYLLATVVVLRVVAHRAWCIYRRTVGDPVVNSRSAGRPLLGVVVPQIPTVVLRWVEPLVLMVVALVLGAMSDAVGSYLMWSGFAMLGITTVRGSLTYNEMLDRLDAGLVPALPITSIPASIPDRMVFDRMDAQLLEA
jgi:hypothetical protein